jgi:hypothetical protein
VADSDYRSHSDPGCIPGYYPPPKIISYHIRKEVKQGEKTLVFLMARKYRNPFCLTFIKLKKRRFVMKIKHVLFLLGLLLLAALVVTACGLNKRLRQTN